MRAGVVWKRKRQSIKLYMYSVWLERTTERNGKAFHWHRNEDFYDGFLRTTALTVLHLVSEHVASVFCKQHASECTVRYCIPSFLIERR